MTQETARPLSKILSFVFIAYEVLAFLYLIFGIGNGTGLGGYIVDLQLRWFNTASMTISAIIGMSLLTIPAVAVGALLLRAFPELNAVMNEAAVASAVKQPLSGPEQAAGLSWRVILSISAGLLLAGAAIGAVLFVMDRQDRAAGVRMLQASDPAPPVGVAYFKLRGRLAGEYIVGYEEKSTRSSTGSIHVFLPVTAAGWTPDSPVRYFVHYQTYGGHRPNLPAAVDSGAEAEVTGALGSPLPIYANRKLSEMGLKIASPHFVLDYEALQGDEIPDSINHWIALGGGGALGLMALLSLSGGKLLAQYRLRKSA